MIKIIFSGESEGGVPRQQKRQHPLSTPQQFLYGLLLILSLLTASSSGLRDVRITLPIAVKKGDNANLICNYDMEGDTLYSVKYYKGRREFYRYTPKEIPAIKVFPHPGIRIEENMSNGSYIVLLALDTPQSGKYSCEVSADAPSFHTTIVSAEMEVVETPEQRPSITGIQSRYRIGDIIKGTCASVHSRPAANLTWTINDIPVSQSNLLDFKITKSLDNITESSSLSIYQMVTHNTFARGKVKLRCYATIYNIYKSFSDKIVEEVNPRILATGHNGAANLLQNDDSSNGLLPDHQMDENGIVVQRDYDPYLQQQFNDFKSSSSSVGPSTMSRVVSTSTLLFSFLRSGNWVGVRVGGLVALMLPLAMELWQSSLRHLNVQLAYQYMKLEHCYASWMLRRRLLLLERWSRKRHIVQSIISQYLIIVLVSLKSMSAIVLPIPS